MNRLPMVIDHATGMPIPKERVVTQLGTAAWYRGGGRAVGHFRVGDFFLGRSEDGVVGLRDDRHALITSGTRGGKGVSVIVPNLCLWPGSVVVIDPKGENAMVTARRRGAGSQYCDGMGQTVRLLDPFNVMRLPDGEKASFNPLDALHPDSEESIDEAARIADALIVSEKSSDPFFDESARAFAKFVMLHVRTSPDYAPHERNLITCRALIMAGDAKAAKLAALNKPKNPPSGFALLFDAMKRNPAFNGVISRGGEMLAHMEASSPKLFGSVAQVARTNTDFLDSPAMARVLQTSTFRISELKTNPKGTSLYISLPQRYMETHARWLRMMTTLVVTEMERVEKQPACGHPVMMVLDEFPALRRMRILENAAAQIAGFGVKLVFVTQTLGQLKDIYQDNWETLVANAGVKLFFCNDDNFTREYVSKSIGEREIIRTVANMSQSAGSSASFGESVSKSATVGFTHSGWNLRGSYSASQSESRSESTTYGHNQSQSQGFSQTIHKRALITPDEVGRLFGNPEDMRAIALVSGYQPMALRRIPYFRDSVFEACFDQHRDHPAPPLKLVIRAIRKKQKEQQEVADFFARAERDRKAQAMRDEQFRQKANYVRRARRDAFIAERISEAMAAIGGLAFGTFIYFIGWPLLSWLIKRVFLE
jgi:type IV secretory pathway TraG/TraD family ATPase VirD4